MSKHHGVQNATTKLRSVLKKALNWRRGDPQLEPRICIRQRQQAVGANHQHCQREEEWHAWPYEIRQTLLSVNPSMVHNIWDFDERVPDANLKQLKT
eukprot:6402172-Amphidinium_carterae.1